MEDDATASITNTMPIIIQQFKGLYGDQLQSVDSNTYDGLKMKTNILESYVQDLTDQNTYLLQAVEELESESLKRLNALEANLLSKSESHRFGEQSELSSSELKSRIAYLCNDIWNLLELVRRLREDGFWYLDGLSFKTITYEDIFGVPPEKCDYKCKNYLDDKKKPPLSHINPPEKPRKKCCCLSFNSK